jgi:RNA polymerase sigma-70 factor (ECF subfamily)
VNDARSLTDGELVEQCRRGRPELFAAIVERHQAAVYGTALRLIGGTEPAIEVTNTVLFKAFRALSTVDVARPLRPWLVQIASHEALNYLRNHRSERTRTVGGEAGELALSRLHNPAPGPEASLLADEERAAIHHAFASLPEHYRLVAVLRYLHDLSYAEIAEQTGIPQNTIGVYLMRARAALRQQLSAQGVRDHDVS